MYEKSWTFNNNWQLSLCESEAYVELLDCVLASNQQGPPLSLKLVVEIHHVTDFVQAFL